MKCDRLVVVSFYAAVTSSSRVFGQVIAVNDPECVFVLVALRVVNAASRGSFE